MKKKDPTSHRIIEKRRRDRMNNCLTDLSRLIPGHYMKKGRGRIEKTEIIEMAIKYLKDLIEATNGQHKSQHQSSSLSSNNSGNSSGSESSSSMSSSCSINSNSNINGGIGSSNSGGRSSSTSSISSTSSCGSSDGNSISSINMNFNHSIHVDCFSRNNTNRIICDNSPTWYKKALLVRSISRSPQR